jgi:tetratricopeptide (TPR) repeat protein
MSAVAIHSIGDFGIHVPSVALATAVVAAYSTGWEKASERVIAHHPALALVFVLAALLVAAADWRTWQADRLRTAAGSVPRPTDAVPFLEAAARVRPNDPGVWEELALAHLLAAAESSHTALTALVGFGALAEMPNDLPGGDPDGHVTAALKAARMGRNLQPLAAGPHLRLGAFTDRFARSESSQVHLDRAKRVGSVEPDVWYVCGRIAASRGDWSEALADWRASLVRSPRRLTAIARLAAGRVSPEEFRSKGLPDDPALWFAATPQLFPDETAPGRAAWMRTIDERSTRREPESVGGFLAWGSALEDLSDGPGALRVWRRAVERYPDDVQLHDRLAASLEAEELFEEAVPVLEWLAAHRPEVGNYGHRLAAAKHALALKAEIDRP